MAKKLRSVLDSLDELPEALHELYEEVNGRYVLALDGIDDHPGVASLRTAFRKEKERRGEATQKLEALRGQFGELGDLEPDQIKEQLGKLQQLEDKQLLDAGKVEELLTQRVERMKKDHERQLQALQQQLQEKDGLLGKASSRLSQVLVDQEITNIANKAGVRQTALTDVLNRGRGIFKLLEDKVLPLDAEGSVVNGKTGLDPMSMDEWIAGLAGDAPHLFEPSTGAGAPGSRPPQANGGFKKTLSLSDNRGIGQNLEAVARGEVRFTDS